MNFKKTIAPKFFLLFLMFALSKFSNAQRLDVFGGVSLSGFNHKIGGTKQDNSGTINLNVGMGVFVPFKPKEFEKSEDGNGLFPSVQYVRKGVARSTIIDPLQADVKLGFLQLDLPVMVMGGNYGFGIGPYAAYAISGTKKFRTGNTNKQSIDFGKDINRFDYGLHLQMILSIFKLEYDLGLANMGVGANGTVKTRNFNLSLEIPLVMK